MKILIFKTDVSAARHLDTLGSVFKNFPQVQKWTVDLEDVDKVLRVEIPESDQLRTKEVVVAMNQAGFQCEELHDEQIAA